jgi:hypothetical protein
MRMRCFFSSRIELTKTSQKTVLVGFCLVQGVYSEAASLNKVNCN